MQNPGGAGISGAGGMNSMQDMQRMQLQMAQYQRQQSAGTSNAHFQQQQHQQQLLLQQQQQQFGANQQYAALQQQASGGASGMANHSALAMLQQQQQQQNALTGGLAGTQNSVMMGGMQQGQGQNSLDASSGSSARLLAMNRGASGAGSSTMQNIALLQQQQQQLKASQMANQMSGGFSQQHNEALMGQQNESLQQQNESLQQQLILQQQLANMQKQQTEELMSSQRTASASNLMQSQQQQQLMLLQQQQQQQQQQHRSSMQSQQMVPGSMQQLQQQQQFQQQQQQQFQRQQMQQHNNGTQSGMMGLLQQQQNMSHSQNQSSSATGSLYSLMGGNGNEQTAAQQASLSVNDQTRNALLDTDGGNPLQEPATAQGLTHSGSSASQQNVAVGQQPQMGVMQALQHQQAQERHLKQQQSSQSNVDPLSSQVSSSNANLDHQHGGENSPTASVSSDPAGNAPSSASQNGQRSFLDGSFAGGWQSNADLPDRRRVIFSILEVIRTIRPEDTSKMSTKLPHMAKSLEEHLYRSAPSREDYMNFETLKERLQAIAQGLDIHHRSSDLEAPQLQPHDGTQSNFLSQASSTNQSNGMSRLLGQTQNNGMQRSAVNQQSLAALGGGMQEPNSGGSSSNLVNILSQASNVPTTEMGSTQHSALMSSTASLGMSHSNLPPELSSLNVMQSGTWQGQVNTSEQGSDATSAASRNASRFQNPDASQKTKIIAQQQERLLLLRHASKCKAGASCPVRFCAQMVTLWKHMKSCRNKECNTSHCLSSRCVLNHYRICKSQNKTSTCEVCGPVMSKIRQQEADDDAGDPLAADTSMSSQHTGMGSQPGNVGVATAPSGSGLGMQNLSNMVVAKEQSQSALLPLFDSNAGAQPDHVQIQQLQAQQIKLQGQLESLKQLQKHQEQLLEQQARLQEQAQYVQDPMSPQAQQLQQQQVLLHQLQKRGEQQQLQLQQEIQSQSRSAGLAQAQAQQLQADHLRQQASLLQGAGIPALQDDSASQTSRKRRRSSAKGKRNGKASEGNLDSIDNSENSRARRGSLSSSGHVAEKRAKLDAERDDGVPSTISAETTSSVVTTSGETPGSLLSSLEPSQILAHLDSLDKEGRDICRRVTSVCMSLIMDLIDDQFGWVFHDAVDPVTLGLPDYFDVVKQPMHLELVKKKLDCSIYQDTDSFAKDVRLVFENAILYNGETSEVGELASSFLTRFGESYTKLSENFDPALKQRKKGPGCTLCNKSDRLFPTVGHDVAQEANGQIGKEEPMTKCESCGDVVYDVCALFQKSAAESADRFVCPTCLLCSKLASDAQDSGPACKSVDDIDHGNLSRSIEEGLQKLLKSLYTKAVENCDSSSENIEKVEGLKIRVLSDTQKKYCVSQEVRKTLRRLPSEFEARSKCIALFQTTEGVDVLLFTLFVDEFGGDCATPNRGRVNISFVDSVKYLEPQRYRIAVFQGILVEYLRSASQRGFTHAHIWCRSPLPDTFAFPSRPSSDSSPDAKKLGDWFQGAIQMARENGLALETTNMYDDMGTLKDIVEGVLPYFEGDYFALQIAKEIDSDSFSAALFSEKMKRMKNDFIVVRLDCAHDINDASKLSRASLSVKPTPYEISGKDKAEVSLLEPEGTKNPESASVDEANEKVDINDEKVSQSDAQEPAGEASVGAFVGTESLKTSVDGTNKLESTSDADAGTKLTKAAAEESEEQMKQLVTQEDSETKGKEDSQMQVPSEADPGPPVSIEGTTGNGNPTTAAEHLSNVANKPQTPAEASDEQTGTSSSFGNSKSNAPESISADADLSSASDKGKTEASDAEETTKIETSITEEPAKENTSVKSEKDHDQSATGNENDDRKEKDSFQESKAGVADAKTAGDDSASPVQEEAPNTVESTTDKESPSGLEEDNVTEGNLADDQMVVDESEVKEDQVPMDLETKKECTDAEVTQKAKESKCGVISDSQSDAGQSKTASRVACATVDDDGLVENHIFESPHHFFLFCKQNHCHFDELRRAKYSTMKIVYELLRAKEGNQTEKTSTAELESIQKAAWERRRECQNQAYD